MKQVKQAIWVRLYMIMLGIMVVFGGLIAPKTMAKALASATKRNLMDLVEGE